MNCLIVEDNEEMRRFLRYLLRGVADGITECCDGADALTAYEQCQPDVVVMDVQMPGTNGLAATKEITDAYPQARVLILTDYTEVDMRQAARQAGASGYLLKDNLLQLPGLIAAG